MADVTMPQLGETVTEGTITRWFKNVGDQVAEDEVLFEVSTDKVDSEVPSPAAGYLTEIKVAEGDTVDVGVVLAVISDAPGAGGNGSAPAAEAPPAPAPAPEPEPAPAPPPAPAPAAAAPPPAAPAPAPAPVAAAPADEAPAATPPPAAAPPAPAPTNGALNKPLSPVVRRLIAEHGLNPDAITGTGANGRITRNDVLAVIDAGGATAPAAAPRAPAAAPAPAAPAPAPATAAPAPAPAAAPPAAAPAPIVRSGERDTAIPHSNIRRRTAEHMTRSLATSAHVYAAVEVDFEGVEVVRRAQQEAFKASEGIGLNYLPFIGRAVIDAIYEFPQVNASFGENELVVHNYVNLGIAVDLDFQGLMVPVIQDADGKRLRLIAREIADLARKARSKKLSPDDIVGGTFTITNPGPFGTLITLPIINQPQVAILSTDGISRKPVVVDLPDGGEAIAIHSVGTLALTWDHRAFDGAYAAAFLRRIKELIQTRDWSAELLKLPLTKAVHPAG